MSHRAAAKKQTKHNKALTLLQPPFQPGPFQWGFIQVCNFHPESYQLAYFVMASVIIWLIKRGDSRLLSIFQNGKGISFPCHMCLTGQTSVRLLLHNSLTQSARCNPLQSIPRGFELTLKDSQWKSWFCHKLFCFWMTNARLVWLSQLVSRFVLIPVPCYRRKMTNFQVLLQFIMSWSRTFYYSGFYCFSVLFLIIHIHFIVVRNSCKSQLTSSCTCLLPNTWLHNHFQCLLRKL